MNVSEETISREINGCLMGERASEKFKPGMKHSKVADILGIRQIKVTKVNSQS